MGRANNNHMLLSVLNGIVAVILPAVLVLIVESLARGSIWETFLWIGLFTKAAIANYILWFVLVNFIQFLRKRPFVWIYQFALTVAVVCVAIGNKVKLNFRTTPFVFSDLSVLNAAFAMAKDYLPNCNIPMLIVGLVIMVSVFAAVVVKKFWNCTAGRYRLILCGLSAIFLAAFIVPQSRAWIKQNAWGGGYSLYNNYMDNGFAQGFLQSAEDSYSEAERPSNYTPFSIEQVLQMAQVADDAEMKTDANIIVILGEAIMDTEMLSGIDFTSDPTPVLHKLLESCPTGYATVGWQGGGTCYAESAVLTGMEHVDYTKLGPCIIKFAIS